MMKIINNLQKKHMAIIAVAVFVLLCLIVGGEAVYANTVIVGIDPPIIEITSLPGERIQGVVTVFAKTGEQVIMSAKSFVPKGNLGYIEVVDSADDSVSWVSFENNDFVVGGKNNEISSVQVGYLIQIPPDAMRGDYNLVLFAENRGQTGSSWQNVSHVAKIGSNVLITVLSSDEPYVPKLSIKNSDSNLFVFRLPIVETFSVTNEGSIRFPMNGQVTVTDVWGENIYSSLILPLNVLSGSSRLVQIVESDNGVLEIMPHFKGVFSELKAFNLYQISLP
ncbi:hypothetical protein GW793_03340 [bacterium]|uniref:Uncharacterized protein n=2 Tax=Katanobacteria TaxID=422282 RepID=A0A2M7X2V0_UNCKA|nr:hypothetical protein [bacterium]PJA40495.1 MAG: hypothetical protein CO179_02045 [candidate division WWE3 bacterium CG_4_9_14_3_um_filter_39_7]